MAGVWERLAGMALEGRSGGHMARHAEQTGRGKKHRGWTAGRAGNITGLGTQGSTCTWTRTT